MELFVYNKGDIEVSPVLLSMPLFKKIYDRDKSKDKNKAHKEFAYIYFMCDYKSDFNDILDLEIKEKEIINALFDGKYQADDLVKEGMEFYKKRQETLSSHLLEGAKEAVNKINLFFREFDLNKLDDKGKPIYNVSQISTTLNNLSKTIEGLKNLEDIVRKERENATRARGGGELGMFEDPD